MHIKKSVTKNNDFQPPEFHLPDISFPEMTSLPNHSLNVQKSNGKHEIEEIFNVNLSTEKYEKLKQKQRIGNPATNWASELFWTQHYTDITGYFEWFAEYSDFREQMERIICEQFEKPLALRISPQTSEETEQYFKELRKWRMGKLSNMKVFDLGCGSSQLAANLILNSGFKHVTCLDRCGKAIDNTIQAWYDSYGINSNEVKILSKRVKFIVRDILKTEIKRRSFDIIIDKGTLDALDCGHSEFNSERVNFSDNLSLVVEVGLVLHRILVSNGYLVILTSRSINKRMEFVHELHNKYQRYFRKIYSCDIKNHLIDYKDGECGTSKLLILQAVKDSKKHKLKK